MKARDERSSRATIPLHILTLGRARATRYGLPKRIRGDAAQQPLWWTDETGRVQELGVLSFLAGDQIHIESAFFPDATSCACWLGKVA